MASRDFLAKRIRTRAIIGSGDNSDRPSLLVYPETSAINSLGGFTNSNMLEHVGFDVINFFSGSIGSMVYTDEDGILQPNNGERGVNLFGGDIHVSGTLLVDGAVISNGTNLGEENLKAYSEFGDFLLLQEVTGDNVVAIGNNLTASSDNSIVIGYNNFIKTENYSLSQGSDEHKFIFGGRDNTIFTKESEIYGGSNNEISGSGSNNKIIGSINSNIHSIYSDLGPSNDLNVFNSSIVASTNSKISGSSDSFIIFSDTAEIIDGGRGIGIYSDNLKIGANVNDAFSFGDDNQFSGETSNLSNLNVVFGRYTQVHESSQNFAIGLNYTFSNSDLTNNPRGNLSLTGSNSNFVLGNKTHLDNGYNNVIFSSTSSLDNIDNSLIKGDNLSLKNIDNNFILSSNVDITGSNNNFIVASNKSSATNSEDITVSQPTLGVQKLTTEKLAIGIANSTNELIDSDGYNTIISAKGAQAKNSAYSFIIGGFSQSTNGLNNGILGGFGNTISGNSFGSYILGGYNNTINAVEKSIILGNHSNQNASSSILIGNNIDNELNNYYIIGEGDESINQISRNSAVVLSASYFKFGELSKPELYGTEVNFFVSGSVGSRERHFIDPNAGEYGVAVFGGDVHISGTLSGGNFGLDKLFLDGGDAKNKNRTLGNKDDFNLSFITNNTSRMRIDNNGSICIGNGQETEYSLLHIRTGSLSSYDFESSKDYSPAKKYPFVISRAVDNTNEDNIVFEVGMAFQGVASQPGEDACTDTLDEEPGAAITHYTQGGLSQGGLNFKTKTGEGQFTLSESSLSTKLKLTKEGYLLLGSDDQNNIVVDLRLTGSEYPLIQASGSQNDDRTVFLLVNDSDYNIPNSQTDTSFYVSGSINSKVTDPDKRKVSVFGGDLLVSGTLYAESDLRIDGEINSSDNALLINTNHLTASQHILAHGSVNVRQNISGSNIKGAGNEIQDVNLSSVWEQDPNNPSHLILTENIDGNSGLSVFEMGSFAENVRKMHLGQILPEDLHVMISVSENTRLYDAYLESNRVDRSTDEETWGQPIVWNSDTNSEENLPASTIRVTRPRHLIVSSKI